MAWNWLTHGYLFFSFFPMTLQLKFWSHTHITRILTSKKFFFIFYFLDLALCTYLFSLIHLIFGSRIIIHLYESQICINDSDDNIAMFLRVKFFRCGLRKLLQESIELSVNVSVKIIYIFCISVVFFSLMYFSWQKHNVVPLGFLSVRIRTQNFQASVNIILRRALFLLMCA